MSVASCALSRATGAVQRVGRSSVDSPQASPARVSWVGLYLCSWRAPHGQHPHECDTFPVYPFGRTSRGNTMAGKPREPRHRIYFRDWRLHAGRTQREVALACNVGMNTVHYWDTGRAPHLEYLPDLARLFGCSIDDLFAPPKPSR